MSASTSFPARLHRIFVNNNARVWMQVAYAVSTYKIVVTPLKDMSETIFLGWFGIVGGVELLKRVVAAKLGVTAEEPKP